MARTWEGVIEWGHASGVDWMIGRKLPNMWPLWVSGIRRLRPTFKTSVALPESARAARGEQTVQRMAELLIKAGGRPTGGSGPR
jgi:hypothetical protein